MDYVLLSVQQNSPSLPALHPNGHMYVLGAEIGAGGGSPSSRKAAPTIRPEVVRFQSVRRQWHPVGKWVVFPPFR